MSTPSTTTTVVSGTVIPTPPQPSLTSLPVEILQKILDCLEKKDVVKLTHTRRRGALSLLASSIIYHTVVLDNRIYRRPRDYPELPPARYAGFVREVVITDEWRFSGAQSSFAGDELQFPEAEGDQENNLEFDAYERLVIRRSCSFLRACTNLSSLCFYEFSELAREHPLLTRWFGNPRFNFVSILSPTLTRIRTPQAMPTWCLKDLVSRCPQLARINAGYFPPQDDDDDDDDDSIDGATRSERRVTLLSVLHLVPNLNELDIDFLEDVEDFEMAFERLANLHCVRYNAEELLHPYEDIDDEETTYRGLHDLVAELAGRTTVQIVSESKIDNDQDFFLNSDLCNLPWMRSKKFRRLLPSMIKLPVSTLILAFTESEREKSAMLAKPHFAFMRTALRLLITDGTDDYVTRILRLRFPNLRNLHILAENHGRPHGFLNLLMEIFGGGYENLEELDISTKRDGSCVDVRRGQYAPFWRVMKVGTLPPPPVKLGKVWLPFPDGESVADLISWLHRGNIRRITVFKFSLLPFTELADDSDSGKLKYMKKVFTQLETLLTLRSTNPQLEQFTLSWITLSADSSTFFEDLQRLPFHLKSSKRSLPTLSSIASSIIYKSVVLDKRIYQRPPDYPELPPARYATCVEEVIISCDEWEDTDVTDKGSFPEEEEEKQLSEGEADEKHDLKLSSYERGIVRKSCSFLRACTNMTSLCFLDESESPDGEQHPLVRKWLTNPRFDFVSVLPRTLKRVHLPPDMRLYCLRDLVEGWPHIERINVGWVLGPDDEEYYDMDEFDERLSVTAVLDLFPNLNELDIEFVPS
ncbi:hypothetical protein HK102_013585 [Quaeritorhiza haematococci]|nr:hypothetical protein HK102_013585 [Quaeritorhiza haematococci]